MLGNLVKFSFLRSWKLTFSLCGSMQKDNCIMGNELAEIWVEVPRPAYLKNEAELFSIPKESKKSQVQMYFLPKVFLWVLRFPLSPKNHTSKFQFEADFYEAAKTSVSPRSSPLGSIGLDFYKKERTFFDFFIKPFECFLGQLLLSPWDKLQSLRMLHVIPKRSSID